MPRDRYLTPEQYEELTDILQAGEDNESCLTPFERTFVDDMQNRVAQWGHKTLLSPKQWGVLERIKGRVG